MTNSYQVRFNVLQAGFYGSPQHRRRIIFWGARRGIPLPEFPIPTHVFATQWSVQLDTGLRLDHVARDPDRPHRGAPLRAVTVDDVISDLVRFSHSFYRCQTYLCLAVAFASHSPSLTGTYPHLFVVRFFCCSDVVPESLHIPYIIRNCRRNPHAAIEARRADKAEMKKRAAIGIPAFEAVSYNGAWDKSEEDPFPGYPDGVPYASPPRTSYQARARQGIAEDADVELHYTPRFSESVVERLVTPSMHRRILFSC